MDRVKVAAIQMTLREGDVDGNAAAAHDLLEQAGREGVGLAVLPEMWWTGFSYRLLPAFAEQTAASLEAVGEIARRHRMAVVGGWPEREGERVYNSAFAIGPDGEVRGAYRKIHLFHPMKEDRFLAAGERPVAVDFPFGKTGLMLCYDLRFPELGRRLALAGAKVIVVPSQWPEERIEHFWLLLRARAVENQLFVVGANRTGRGGKVAFGGYSGIIGPRGETLAECGSRAGIALAEIDPEEVGRVRRGICYLDDRDPAVDGLSPL